MNYAVEKDYVDFAVVKNELKTQRQPTPRYNRGTGDIFSPPYFKGGVAAVWQYFLIELKDFTDKAGVVDFKISKMKCWSMNRGKSDSIQNYLSEISQYLKLYVAYFRYMYIFVLTVNY